MVGAIAGLAMALSAAAAGAADAPSAVPTAAPSVKQTEIGKQVDATIENGPAVIVGHLPNGVVDKLGVVEARAAADAQGAAFIALSAAKPDDAQEVLARFGVTSTPTVLVVSAKGKVLTQLSGYSDRETVRQAIVNAKR